MPVLLGSLVAMTLAPSGDPRTIDPAANRPEIVAPSGSPTEVEPPKIRPPKGTRPASVPKAGPTTEPGPRLEVEPGPKPVPGTVGALEPELPPQGCMPERGRCWRLNVGGIVAASVGVGMLGTGIGLMQAPQLPVPDEPVHNYSLRPPGVMLVTLGAVSTVAGVLMIVAGRAVHARAQREGRTARLQLYPGGLRW